MADPIFNLSNLEKIYKEALVSSDKSFACDISIGKGKFLIMMFLAADDKEAKDNLFVYMRNINYMQKVKLYGSHDKGIFNLYVTKQLQNNCIKELQITPYDGGFVFQNFLEQFNKAIPMHIDHDDKIKTIRKNRDIIKSLKVIDDMTKTVFIGSKKVSNGSPKERTLRKLYMYVDADKSTIDKYIAILKVQNKTVAWTTPDKKERSADIFKMLQQEESKTK